MASDNKPFRNNSSMANALVSSGEDLPLLQPEPPPEGTTGEDNVSLENPLDLLSPEGDAAQGGFQQAAFDQQQFAESEAIFSDIRSFGETGQSAPEQAPLSMEAPATSAPVARPKPRLVTAAPPVDAAEVPISSNDSLPGWKIERYLGLVSAWASLEAGDADPIAQASAQLSANAQARGANAVVSVKFQQTGIEGRGLLLVGTAVVVSGE